MTIDDLTSFLLDESGATSIEYALIAAFIAIAIVGSLGLVGDAVTSVFTDEELTDAFPE